ncbi:MAG: hypothetical protein GY934_08975 [Gammaproteobacteria bacterium]|nr:hypothetical protein [Gammaproteobacteria bacterium]
MLFIVIKGLFDAHYGDTTLLDRDIRSKGCHWDHESHTIRNSAGVDVLKGRWKDFVWDFERGCVVDCAGNVVREWSPSLVTSGSNGLAFD